MEQGSRKQKKEKQRPAQPAAAAAAASGGANRSAPASSKGTGKRLRSDGRADGDQPVAAPGAAASTAHGGAARTARPSAAAAPADRAAAASDLDIDALFGGLGERKGEAARAAGDREAKRKVRDSPCAHSRRRHVAETRTAAHLPVHGTVTAEARGEGC